jgi:hypothetical protein
MGDVIRAEFLTKADLPVDRVLDGAKDLESVFVLGRDAEGGLVAASSTGDVGEILLMVEEWKHKLLSGGYAD